MSNQVKSPPEKTLKVTFKTRIFGNAFPTYSTHLVSVESDNSDEDTKKQINEYFRDYVDNKNIVEYNGYTIKD